MTNTTKSRGGKNILKLYWSKRQKIGVFSNKTAKVNKLKEKLRDKKDHGDSIDNSVRHKSEWL